MFLRAEIQDRLLLSVAIAAAVLIHISIAASQIFLGLGILLLLIFHQKLAFPRIWIPLACFFLWTALADVLSPDPWGGRAQIRKFFVFLLIPLIYGVFRRQFAKTPYLIAGWVLAATASGAWALVQFAIKYQQDLHAPQGFYAAYLERRITGFDCRNLSGCPALFAPAHEIFGCPASRRGLERASLSGVGNRSAYDTGSSLVWAGT